MKVLSCILAAVLILILASCANLPTKPKPDAEPVSGIPDAAQPSKIVLPWDGKHADADKWTMTIQKEIIKKEMVKLSPVDIMSFCPGYAKADDQGKLVAWMNLISIMTKFESSFNPKTKFMEPPPLGYESIGLMQLSYQDQPNYPTCELNRSLKNLEDGSHNLRCGLIILNKLVQQDNRIAGQVSGRWKGGARYWSVLRFENKGKPRPSYNSIISHMKSVTACK